MPNQSCWSCQKDPGSDHFCQSCQKIQPLSGEDYFAFMGAPRKIVLDLKVLKKTFYGLSRKLHPDLFHGKSFKEKILSIERTAFLNKAYKTLKDSATCAEYLMNLEVPAQKKERAKVDPILVSRIFEIQEMVEEEKRTNDPQLRAKLEASKKEAGEEIDARRRSLQGYFTQWELSEGGQAGEEKKELARNIRKILDEITYLKNVIHSIETGGQSRP